MITSPQTSPNANQKRSLAGPVRFRPRQAAFVVLRRTPLFFALLATWYLVGLEKGSSSSMPTVQGVASEAGRLIRTDVLFTAAVTSWDTVMRGFVIATLLGVPAGLLLGSARTVRDWFGPLVDVLRPIAPFAWIPMAILWFGGSRWTSVFITGYAAFFPIVTNTASGVSRIDRSLLLAARALGAGKVTTFFRIVLPGALPLIIVGVRLGIGMSWAAVVAAEIATGQSSTGAGGLGFILYTNLAVTFDMNTIVVAMIAIGVSAYAVDLLIGLADRKLVTWRTQ